MVIELLVYKYKCKSSCKDFALINSSFIYLKQLTFISLKIFKAGRNVIFF